MRVRPSDGQLRSWMFIALSHSRSPWGGQRRPRSTDWARSASRRAHAEQRGKRVGTAEQASCITETVGPPLPTLLQFHISGLDHVVPALDLGAPEGGSLG